VTQILLNSNLRYSTKLSVGLPNLKRLFLYVVWNGRHRHEKSI
jgi:hypothetical protein